MCAIFLFQVVANCLLSLQEIWNLEAAVSEDASMEIEALLSKKVVYYLLNRYAFAVISQIGCIRRRYLIFTLCYPICISWFLLREGI